MKNFISAGEAIRDASNPFIAFLEEGETASTAATIELSAFHDPVNNLTLVTNRATTYSPQSGETMTAIPDTNTVMTDEVRAELASTCTLMSCAACKRRALVENELSFTIAGEEMACPVCGADTQFNYVDDGDGDDGETASATTLAEIQALTFTGNDDTDGTAYDTIEQFILGDAPMIEKITALGVMMRAMGVEQGPTEDDVAEFISEAQAYADGDEDDAAYDDTQDADEEFASAHVAGFGPRWVAAKFELADDMTALTPDEEDTVDIDPETGLPRTVVADPTEATNTADPAVDPATVTESTDAGPAPVVAQPMETITDADLTGTFDVTDGDDAITMSGGEDSVAAGATVELDDNLESMDDGTATEDNFGLETFGDDEETVVTVASLIDRSRPLTFAPLNAAGTEVAVFVGSTHVGTLNRTVSTETASVMYDRRTVQRAFTAAFNAHRDSFETASELREYGFRPVQFRVRLDEVASARVAAAADSARIEMASKVSKAVNRHAKLLNLAMMGIAKDHFKVPTALITETAALLERSGVQNASMLVRRLFAARGPEFFAAVVEKANELAPKSDEHLNGVSEAIADKEFVGGDDSALPVVPAKTPIAPAHAAPVPATRPAAETASVRPVQGLGNSSTGKVDFNQLVRSVSRRHR